MGAAPVRERSQEWQRGVEVAQSLTVAAPKRGLRSRITACRRSARELVEAESDELRQPVGGLERPLVERPEVLEAGRPVPDGPEGRPNAVAPRAGQERGDLRGQIAQSIVADDAHREEPDQLTAT